MDIAKRVSDLLKEKGLNQTYMAKEMGTTDSFISNMLHGRSKISLENLLAMCEIIGVTPSEFFLPFNANKTTHPKYLENFFKACIGLTPDQVDLLFPFVVQLISCGWQANRPNSEAATYHQISSSRLRISGDAAAGPPLYSPANWDDEEIEVPEKYDDDTRFFPIRARGDSMEPKIHLGDVVIVQRDTPPDDGQIALVRLAGLADDEYTIKRVYYRNGNVTLKSYNHAYPPMTYAADAVRTCEKVVHIIPRS